MKILCLLTALVACSSQETSDVKWLSARTDNGSGADLLLWSKTQSKTVDGQPLRCWYYKEHSRSTPIRERFNSSVLLTNYGVADVDVMNALNQRHIRYLKELGLRSIPLNSCIQPKPSLIGCINYLGASNFASDKMLAIAFAKNALQNNKTDLDNRGIQRVNIWPDPLTRRVRELQVREIQDIVRKMPEVSSYGKCSRSNVAYNAP